MKPEEELFFLLHPSLEMALALAALTEKAFPRLVPPHWLTSEENGLMENDTLPRATKRGMLFLCQQHWRKFSAETESLLSGLCTQCKASVSPWLDKFRSGELTWFLLKPCATCKQLKEVATLLDMQRTRVITWNVLRH